MQQYKAGSNKSTSRHLTPLTSITLIANQAHAARRAQSSCLPWERTKNLSRQPPWIWYRTYNIRNCSLRCFQNRPTCWNIMVTDCLGWRYQFQECLCLSVHVIIAFYSASHQKPIYEKLSRTREAARRTEMVPYRNTSTKQTEWSLLPDTIPRIHPPRKSRQRSEIHPRTIE